MSSDQQTLIDDPESWGAVGLLVDGLAEHIAKARKVIANGIVDAKIDDRRRAERDLKTIIDCIEADLEAEGLVRVNRTERK